MFIERMNKNLALRQERDVNMSLLMERVAVVSVEAINILLLRSKDIPASKDSTYV